MYTTLIILISQNVLLYFPYRFIIPCLTCLQVTIIYSYENGVGSGGDDPLCPGYTTSGTDELKRLAAITGGDFVEIDKFDIDDILGIMEQGAEEVKVRISVKMLQWSCPCS